MYCNYPLPLGGRGDCTTRASTRARANQNQQSTAEMVATRRSVHVEAIVQPHQSTRAEEYHAQ